MLEPLKRHLMGTGKTPKGEMNRKVYINGNDQIELKNPHLTYLIRFPKQWEVSKEQGLYPRKKGRLN